MKIFLLVFYLVFAAGAAGFECDLFYYSRVSVSKLSTVSISELL